MKHTQEIAEISNEIEQEAMQIKIPSLKFNNYLRGRLTAYGDKREKEALERIRKLFVSDCEKNLKTHGGSFVSYEFEHKITNTT